MATFKLKDNRTEDGFVPGVGNYVAGVLKNAPDNFENPNFELVTTSAQEQQPATPQIAASPAPVAPAALPAAPAPPLPPPPINTQTQQGVN
jgi:hypothetical protein